MSSKEKHPRIMRPTAEQLTNLLQNKSAIVRQLYLDTHLLVLETLPDVICSVDCKDGQMGYSVRQYGYNGWGMAALSAHNKWVLLIFMRGVDHEDHDKLLEGAGKKIRHIKLRSLNSWRRTAARFAA